MEMFTYDTSEGKDRFDVKGGLTNRQCKQVKNSKIDMAKENVC